MADYAVKYADGRGQIHQQVASASSEKELREKYTQQGFLVYSIKARAAAAGAGILPKRKKLNHELPSRPINEEPRRNGVVSVVDPKNKHRRAE